jgi:outer membrane biosynthesis protein TonB
MDPGTKRLALIAGGLGGALLLLVAGPSLFGHHSSGLPVVQADVHPIRTKPDNPGGMQLAGTNDPILSGDTGPQNDKLAPPPETPEPQLLHAESPAATPTPTSTSTPAPAAATATPEPAPPAAPPAPSSAAAVPPAPSPAQAAPAPTTPAPRPAAIERKPAPAAPHQPTKPAEVQLAAVPTEQAAKSEWARLVKRFPLLASHKPQMIRAERSGHPIWRLRTGGFADTAQATSFCEHVRAKGGGCEVASF